MTNEFKYYKAELNGKTLDIRATKRDYKVAMVITWDNGSSTVDSMNSSPRTKASVLKDYGFNDRARDSEQMEEFNNTTVQAVPLTLTTKEEHTEVKARKRAASDAWYAERAAKAQAAKESS